MVLSRKKLKPYHPPLIMNNVVIKEVDRHRHLGITFSSDLNWHNHIKEIATKTWQRLNMQQCICNPEFYGDLVHVYKNLRTSLEIQTSLIF